ncbi:MAG TPA: response regulator [Acidimicrobiales bacterium]|nr:response regulator [Acidimicrobiales bacterium]
MAVILVASDASFIHDELRAALAGEHEIVPIAGGRSVRQAVVDQRIDLAILDMQMGSMGGIATTMDLHLEESGGRIEHVPVLLLLDRRADVFMARRAEAEGFLVKPISPLKLRKAVREILAGKGYEDDAYTPSPVLAT